MLPQTKAFLEARKREAEELKQRVQQLAAEHHSEQQSKEREVTSYRLDGFAARVLSSQEGRVDAVCVLIEANASVNQQTKVMEPLHVESSYSGSVLPFPSSIFAPLSFTSNLRPSLPSSLLSLLLYLRVRDQHIMLHACYDIAVLHCSLKASIMLL